MSEEHVELVKREYAAFASRDWATLAEVWHPDIEYQALDPATYRGHAELREGFMGWSELYAEWWARAEMHNPLRSERDVFRAVVIIGLGAGAVIGLTLLTRPAVGAALLAAEVGLGIGLLWRGARGTLPHQAEVAHREDPTYRVLVV